MKSGARFHLRDEADAEIKHRMWKRAALRALGSPRQGVGAAFTRLG